MVYGYYFSDFEVINVLSSTLLLSNSEAWNCVAWFSGLKSYMSRIIRTVFSVKFSILTVGIVGRASCVD